ncbi:MAG: hypothetical protein WKG01_22870 [Kofleriaceae bacterium]
MTRRTTLALLLLASTASADPAPLTSEQVKLFAKQGYKTPVVVFESATLRLAKATRYGKPRLVILTAAGSLIDGGKLGVGTLSVSASPSTTAGLTLLELGYTKALASGASDSRATLWVVRDSGAIACEVSGSSSNSLGTSCGSSGWTSAQPTLGAGVLDVKYDIAGQFSVADGKRGCLNRSPINHSHTARWTLPPRGKCKQAAAPKSDEP